MARMKPPKVPEVEVPVLSPEELSRLLKACSGSEFDERRDLAIIRLFIDTGMRLSELATMRVTSIDFENQVALRDGQGPPPARVPLRP